MNDGRHEEALSIIQSGENGSIEPTEIQMSLIRYASMAGLDSASEYILELMEMAPDDEVIISFIANLDQVWSSRELASKLMQRAENVIGTDSPLYALCNARWVRAYNSEDQAAVSSAIKLLDQNVLRNSPNSHKGLERMSSLKDESNIAP